MHRSNEATTWLTQLISSILQQPIQANFCNYIHTQPKNEIKKGEEI